jgi:hypothetical protein
LLGELTVPFRIDPVWREKLINGWDDIDLTRQHGRLAIRGSFARTRAWHQTLSYSARGGGPITRATGQTVAHNDGQHWRQRGEPNDENRVMAGVLVAGGNLFGATAHAEETITAVHAFPETLIYTQSFLSFVDKVNEAGEGVIVQIDVRGGPEAIGMFQQPDAVRDGIVDMVYTPGSFYGGALPEKDALVASNLTAIETRENGGIELIDQIHQERWA